MMGEQADYTNDGGRCGLFEKEHQRPKMSRKKIERKPTVDFRDGWSKEEIYEDFLENGFR